MSPPRSTREGAKKRRVNWRSVRPANLTGLIRRGVVAGKGALKRMCWKRSRVWKGVCPAVVDVGDRAQVMKG